MDDSKDNGIALTICNSKGKTTFDMAPPVIKFESIIVKKKTIISIAKLGTTSNIVNFDSSHLAAPDSVAPPAIA